MKDLSKREGSGGGGGEVGGRCGAGSSELTVKEG